MRTAAGIFDVSHMGEIETRGPRRRGFLQHLLSNDVSQDRGRRRAVHGCCAARTAASSTTSSPTGSAPERYLTVTQRRQPRQGPRLVPPQAGGYDVDVDGRRRPTTRCSPSRARSAREIVQAIADARCPGGCRPRRASCSAASALVCGTGYTGEDGVELLLAPGRRAGDLGRAACAAAPCPRGLAARDTLRLEVVLPALRQRPRRGARPDRGRARLGCKEDTGFIGVRRRSRAPVRTARPRSSSPSRSPAPGSPARATRSWAAAR